MIARRLSHFHLPSESFLLNLLRLARETPFVQLEAGYIASLVVLDLDCRGLVNCGAATFKSDGIAAFSN